MNNEVNIAFIIGTGRCGTSLLGKMLNCHSKICVPPELQLIFGYNDNGNRLLEEFFLCGPKGIKADSLSSIIERCCPHKLELFFNYKAYCEGIEHPITTLDEFLPDLYKSIARSKKKSWLIEQTPWYGQRLDLLVHLFPTAKFIHMIRDGRDVALSFARTPWWYRSPYLNLGRWENEIKKISTDASIYLSPDTYLEVKYEDLVANAECELRRICEFLGVDFEFATMDRHRFIDYDEFSQIDVNELSSKAYVDWKKNKSSPVFSGNIQAWRKVNEIFSGPLPSNISDALSRHGYESRGISRAGSSQLQIKYEFSVKNYIDSLEGEADHKRRRIEELEQSFAQQAVYIQGVEADWAARGKVIEDLGQTLAQQAVYIQGVEADWAARGKVIEDLGQTLAQQAVYIQGVEADWVARGKVIEELEQNIADQASHIHGMETVLIKFQNSIYGRCISSLSRLFSFTRNKQTLP